MSEEIRNLHELSEAIRLQEEEVTPHMLEEIRYGIFRAMHGDCGGSYDLEMMEAMLNDPDGDGMSQEEMIISLLANAIGVLQECKKA